MYCVGTRQRFHSQQHVRARLPLIPLITYHLLDSLVFVPIMLGVLFFLFEFFGDQVLAFAVLLTVWGCEIFSAVACRTALSLRIFPRAFLLTMALMHVYHMTWPFGFSYIALMSAHAMLFVRIARSAARTTVGAVAGTVTVVLSVAAAVAATVAMLTCPHVPYVAGVAMQTVMFALWNDVELPALRSGVVSQARLREVDVRSRQIYTAEVVEGVRVGFNMMQHQMQQWTNPRD